MYLSGLSIGYRQRGGGARCVCGGIDATLSSGQLTCLIGPNGTGKSTLLRTLSAFQPPLQGEVVVDGKPINAYNSHQLSRLIGVVLTQKVDAANMTVRELVGIGRSPYTNFWGTLSVDDERIVSESMALAGITALAHRKIQTLSDGERQKTMIAKALAQQTPYIILDEPTAFLDYPSKVELMQTLRRLCRDEGKTILLSSHDVELVLQLADRLWLMTGGSLTTGTPRQLADSGQLTAFLHGNGITFDAQTLQVSVGEEEA